MKFSIIGIIAALALFASSCGASFPASPTPISIEDIQSTSMAAAFTSLAVTYAALPTETLVPPSATPTLTLVPSDTPEPSPTLDVSATPIVVASPTLGISATPAIVVSPTLGKSATPAIVATPTALPTLTVPPTALGSDPCNKVLTAWQGPSTKIMVRYEYKPQGKNDKVVLSLWVMSDTKECGFLPSLSSGPVGQYSALAFVDGEKDFRVTGGFRLTEGSWEIIIRNDTIVAKGGCYPNC